MEIIELIKQGILKIFSPKNYWNNKWPRATIFYNARQGRAYDIKRFIAANCALFFPLRQKLSINDNDEQEDIALKVLKYMVKNYTYLRDSDEYWQFPEETYYALTGDCEDFSNLYVSICRTLGISAYRIKVCTGWVKVLEGSGFIGHAYPIFLAKDNQWRIMDCTYSTDIETEVLDRPVASLDKRYKDIWFTYNDCFSWRQKDMEIKEKRLKDLFKKEVKA